MNKHNILANPNAHIILHNIEQLTALLHTRATKAVNLHNGGSDIAASQELIKMQSILNSIQDTLNPQR